MTASRPNVTALECVHAQLPLGWDVGLTYTPTVTGYGRTLTWRLAVAHDRHRHASLTAIYPQQL